MSGRASTVLQQSSAEARGGTLERSVSIAAAIPGGEVNLSDAAASPEFLAARAAAHAAVVHAGRVRWDGADEAEVVQAERAAYEAEERAYAVLVDVRRRVEEEERAQSASAKAAALSARPMNESIARVVALLQESGPLSGVEIEARRLRGLSHNSVRPVLREAVARGLVARRKVGTRVFWSATAPDSAQFLDEVQLSPVPSHLTTS